MAVSTQDPAALAEYAVSARPEIAALVRSVESAVEVAVSAASALTAPAVSRRALRRARKHYRRSAL